MGIRLAQLEIIRDRLLASDVHDINRLLFFLQHQIDVDKSTQDRESQYTHELSASLVQRMRQYREVVTPLEVESILAFADERLMKARVSDRADLILGVLDKNTFYEREEHYTELEKFMVKLIVG